MKALPDDALFLDPSLKWHPVSPKLVVELRLWCAGPALLGIGLLVLGVLLAVKTSAPLWPFALAGLVFLAIAAYFAVSFLPRFVSSWRYAEREQDLLVRHGRVMQRLTVIPYGRMQVIEVSANPVSRKLDIATVTLVTASASTDARIPGLPSAIAYDLRERLAAKGEASGAGL